MIKKKTNEEETKKTISDLNTKLTKGLFGYDDIIGISRPSITDSLCDKWKEAIEGYLSKDLSIKVPIAITPLPLPPWAIQEYKYTYNYIGNTISYIPLPEETNESEQVPCKCFDMVISLVWDLLHHIKDKEIEIKVITDQRDKMVSTSSKKLSSTKFKSNSNSNNYLSKHNHLLNSGSSRRTKSDLKQSEICNFFSKENTTIAAQSPKSTSQTVLTMIMTTTTVPAAQSLQKSTTQTILMPTTSTVGLTTAAATVTTMVIETETPCL